MNNRWLIALLLLLVAGGALYFRYHGLTDRPVHGDEAIHFDKFRGLWQDKVYVYDPHEYHGPTHYYATLPVVWWQQPADFAATNEFTYRIVTVAFGVMLVVLLLLVADGIGWWAAVVAGVLTAISPAMVYYSRYYIQEIPLVVFTLLAIGGAWRYMRGGNFFWAIVAGLGIGLMHATKETWVIAGFCMAAALMATMVWTALVDGRGTMTLGRKDLFAALLALLAAGGVVVVILSGTFSNWRGPLDSILTYTTYFDRGAGNTDHVNPWDFYLRILLFWQYGNNEPLYRAWRHGGNAPVFTEAFIAVMALAGIVAALWRAPRAVADVIPQRPDYEVPRPDDIPQASLADDPALSSNPKFLMRFLAFYTVLMTVIYSLIPYKTPWCMLGFLHGLILLAGIGVVAILRVTPTLPVKIIVGVLLAAGAGHLGWQSWQLNYGKEPQVRREWSKLSNEELHKELSRVDPEAAARISANDTDQLIRALIDWQDRMAAPLSSSRFNPHVYGHPSTKVFELLWRIRDLEKLVPAGRKLQVRVATLDAWPLPWYLRSIENQIGYWPDVADIPDAAMDADVFITKPDMQDALRGRLTGEYESEYYGLRKGVPLALYVRKPLWDKYIETVKK